MSQKTTSFRFQPWPFADGEVATLMWVRSPYMSGPQKQWKLGATFQSSSGEVKEIQLDWAALPLLIPGQRYRDGQSLENNFESSISRIDLSQTSALGWVDVREVLPESLWHHPAIPDWEEQMWVWQICRNPKVKYAILALTLIRTLHSHGSFLTRGILDPLALDKLSDFKVAGDALQLQINEKVLLPRGQEERDAWMRRVTRLLCDPSFEASYRSVALHRLENPEAPLKCDLPDLSNRWRVRLRAVDVNGGRILYIQDIVDAAPSRGLPINAVEYEHPRYPKKRLPVDKLRTTKKVVTPSQIIVDTESEASKIPRRRSLLSPIDSGLIEQTTLKIRNVGQVEEGVDKSPIVPQQGINERLASLAEQGRNANASQAEVGVKSHDSEPYDPEEEEWFLIADWAATQEDGLNGLREMLVALLKLHPDVEITFRIGPRRFANCSRIFERPYAVVSLARNDGPHIWLIEFAKHPKRPISTLVISGGTYGSWDEFTPPLAKLLLGGLKRQQGWNLDQLTKVTLSLKISVRRLPHSASGPKRWAERVAALLISPTS